MSLSLQTETKIAVGDKMRGYWLIRTQVVTEQEI